MTTSAAAPGPSPETSPGIRAPGPAPDSPVVLDRRRRVTILLVCCLSLLIVGMDNTIVNVALPSIGHDFHTSVSGLQWTVHAYVLVLASLLMLSGSTADRLGRRRTFQVGLLLFTAGSLLCSLAPSLPLLVAFRMLQAVGGSMLNPVAMSIIRNTFHDPRERAQAIGVWGAMMGISIALGPVVGGALTQSVGWRSIFWVNIPIGLTAIALTARYVPESKAPNPRRPDLVGQVLVIVVLASLTYAIIEGPSAGWGSPTITGLLATSAVSTALLVGVERRRREPLLDLRFFRSVPFTGATLIAVVAFATFGGFLFLNTLYLQEARGMSALAAGLATLPLAGTTALLAPVSGWLVGRYGPRPSLVIAGVLLVVADLMLTGISKTTPLDWLLASYVLFGLGFGMVNPPITNTAVSGMPPAQAGVASAIASTSRQVGQSLGVAVVGAAVTSDLHGPLGTALAAASHPGWWIMVVASALVLALGAASTTSWARRSALVAAEHLGADPLTGG